MWHKCTGHFDKCVLSLPVEGFHSAEQFLVVPAVDKHLSVVFDRLGEDGKRACVELFLFASSHLFRRHISFGFDCTGIQMRIFIMLCLLIHKQKQQT